LVFYFVVAYAFSKLSSCGKPGVIKLAKEKPASPPRTAIFAKQKTNKAEQGKDRYVIKATKEISMQYPILLAAVLMILYVLIIVAGLCYVGRHGPRTS
jgi:hypothetical protein